MINLMNRLASCVKFALLQLSLVALVGCGQEKRQHVNDAQESDSSVESMLVELSDRLCHVKPYTEEFGSRLSEAVLRIQSRNLRQKYSGIVKNALLNVHFNAPDLEERSRIADAFCTLSGIHAGLVVLREEGMEESLNMRLRVLEKLQQEITRMNGVADEPLDMRPGFHMSQNGYKESLQEKLRKRGALFEKLLNGVAKDKLTAECLERVSTRFRAIMDQTSRCDGGNK